MSTASLPPPPRYTMRNPWTAMSTSLPPRVVATPAQLVILNALYARTGEDATKEDIKEVSRETGLLEKWIHRWIKRQRSTKGRGNRKISPRVSKYAPDPAGASDGICAQAQTMLLDGSAHPGSSLESHSSMYAWQSNDPLWRHVPDSSAASGSGDSSLCYGMGSWGGSNAGSDPLSPHTSYSISGQGSLHAGPHDTPQASTAPQAPSASQAAPAPQVVQVARPGASFTVPLRFGPPDSQHRIAQTLPSGIDDRSVTGAAHLSPHPMSNETPPSLEHAHPGLSDVHAHTVSPLNSRAHCLDLKHLHIPSSGHTTAMSGLNPPLSAPPSAFSLPATCASEALNLGGAYLYRLFNGPGDDSAIEAPPFHSTCYYGEAVASTAGVPPDLWSPPHTFVSDTSATGVAAEDVPNLAYPPTPVSYEMRMSDLVALTKSIRGAKDAEDAGRALSSLIKYEDAAEIGDNLAQTLASEPQSLGIDRPQSRESDSDNNKLSITGDRVAPGMVIDGEESGEDEDEAVTPCEEMEPFNGNGRPVCQPDIVCVKQEGRDGPVIADGMVEGL